MKNRLCNNIKDEGGFSYAFSASIFVFVFVRSVRFFWVNIQGEFLMPTFWVSLNFSAKVRESLLTYLCSVFPSVNLPSLKIYSRSRNPLKKPQKFCPLTFLEC